MPRAFTRRSILAGATVALARPAHAAATVRIGYVPVIGASALFVADGLGWAREAGLAIEAVKFESGPNAILALSSGTLDALVIGVAPIAVARAKGIEIAIVAACATGGSAFVAAPDLATALRAADPAQAFAAFRSARGKPARLATLPPGAVPNVALNHWLFKLHQTARADVEIVQMGIDSVQQAALSGAVDGATLLEPSLTIALAREPRLVRVVDATQMFPAIPGVVLAVTGRFARDQSAQVEALVRLVVRATMLIKAQPEAAAAPVAAMLGGGLTPTATFAQALASSAVTFDADPRAIMPATKAMLDYEVELGDFAAAPPIDGLFDLGIFMRL